MTKTLKCDMEHDCTTKVSHIDHKGFVYCEPHGLRRRGTMPCRKMTAKEIATLERGETISYQRPKSARAAERSALVDELLAKERAAFAPQKRNADMIKLPGHVALTAMIRENDISRPVTILETLDDLIGKKPDDEVKCESDNEGEDVEYIQKKSLFRFRITVVPDAFDFDGKDIDSR